MIRSKSVLIYVSCTLEKERSVDAGATLHPSLTSGNIRKSASYIAIHL